MQKPVEGTWKNKKCERFQNEGSTRKINAINYYKCNTLNTWSHNKLCWWEECHAQQVPLRSTFMYLMGACSLVGRWALFHDLPWPHECMQPLWQAGFVSSSSWASWMHATFVAGEIGFMIFQGLISACKLCGGRGLFHHLPGHHERMQPSWQVGFVSWSSWASWAHTVLLTGGVCSI